MGVVTCFLKKILGLKYTGNYIELNFYLEHQIGALRNVNHTRGKLDPTARDLETGFSETPLYKVQLMQENALH
jgi:hypothetical protein